MKRRQWFEFNDQAWLPERLRGLVTDYLRMVLSIGRPFSPKAGLLAEVMRATGTRRVVDLCSGGAGPWLHLAGEIERDLGAEIEVTLTDKFPNLAVAQQLESEPRIRYQTDSVDAMNVPADLPGLRTMFDGLHHFRPQDARAILADAVRAGAPIAAMDGLERSWLNLVGMAVLVPAFVLLLTPLVRPVSGWRLLLTYGVPVAPLIITWDGVISVLRCHTPEELRQMTKELDGEPYHWVTETYRHRGIAVTIIVGRPEGMAGNSQ